MNKTIAILLLCFSSATFSAIPESGWWWNPEEPGRGWNIEHQNGKVFVSTFIYTDDGSPIWYTASGELINNESLVANMVRFEGGQCINCEFANAKPVVESHASLFFDTAQTGTFFWEGATIPIQRLNFGYGDDIQSFIGEWVFIRERGNLFGGESVVRFIFDNLVRDDFLEGRYAKSQILRGASVSKINISEYTHMVIGSFNSELSDLYLMRQVGLNKWEGIGASGEDSIEDSLLLRALNSGTKVVAFRIK